MSLSFVATVYNEEKTIDSFINSIIHQTKQPDEIIIVDGGSTDSTLDKLQRYKNKIIIYQQNGNRSIGRNFGIEKAKHPIILISDAGCILDKKWVEHITAPFSEKSTDVVSGYYVPITNSLFEKALSAYTCVMPDRLDTENFLPSSRSIAFKKSVWKKVGGYPEYLDTCEDLVFARLLKKNGYTFVLKKNAIVHWRQQKDIVRAFKQFFSYAKGDGKAFYIRPQTPLLFLRYIFGIVLIVVCIITQSTGLLLVLVFLLLAYFVWAISKNIRYVPNPQALILLPILQVTADIAVICGMSYGLLARLWDTQKIQ